jgi:quercetin dioxygenase-like cupin family protein
MAGSGRRASGASSAVYYEFDLQRRVQMKLLILIAVAALGLGSSAEMFFPVRPQAGIKRTDLQRHDLAIPGREVIQVRVDLAPGVAFGRHRHPGEEIVYVIEGELQYEIEGRQPVTLKAGEVLFIPDGAIHSAKNVGSGNGAELATYIVEKGRPIVVMVR